MSNFDLLRSLKILEEYVLHINGGQGLAALRNKGTPIEKSSHRGNLCDWIQS